MVLCIQGFVCAQICFDLARDKLDQGLAGMLAGFIMARGGGVGLAAGLALYLLLADNRKIRDDYRNNKREQEAEDRKTAEMLAEFEEMRRLSRQDDGKAPSK